MESKKVQKRKGQKKLDGVIVKKDAPNE